MGSCGFVSSGGLNQTMPIFESGSEVEEVSCSLIHLRSKIPPRPDSMRCFSQVSLGILSIKRVRYPGSCMLRTGGILEPYESL